MALNTTRAGIFYSFFFSPPIFLFFFFIFFSFYFTAELARKNNRDARGYAKRGMRAGNALLICVFDFRLILQLD